MIIKDINLDDLDRQEYIHFVKVLLDYYFVQFSCILDLEEADYE